MATRNHNSQIISSENRKRKFPFERDKKDRDGSQATKKVRFEKRNWREGVIAEFGHDHFFIRPSREFSKRDVYAKRALISTYMPEIRKG